MSFLAMLDPKEKLLDGYLPPSANNRYGEPFIQFGQPEEKRQEIKSQDITPSLLEESP